MYHFRKQTTPYNVFKKVSSEIMNHASPLHELLFKLAPWTHGHTEHRSCNTDGIDSRWEQRRWTSRTAAMALVWILTGLSGFLWGLVYLSFSMYLAAAPPFIYSSACLVGFLVLQRLNQTNNAKVESAVLVFKQIQLVLILVLPISMHLVLGGLYHSNASLVMSWSIIAPAGAIFYCQIPSTRPAPICLKCHLPFSVSSLVAGCLNKVTAFPFVLADTHVAILVTAYMAASAVIIACEPFLPGVPPPPLLLRQASCTSDARNPFTACTAELHSRSAVPHCILNGSLSLSRLLLPVNTNPLLPPDIRRAQPRRPTGHPVRRHPHPPSRVHQPPPRPHGGPAPLRSNWAGYQGRLTPSHSLHHISSPFPPPFPLLLIPATSCQALVESLLPPFVAAALEGLPPHEWNARPVDHFERCTLVQCDLVPRRPHLLSACLPVCLYAAFLPVPSPLPLPVPPRFGPPPPSSSNSPPLLTPIIDDDSSPPTRPRHPVSAAALPPHPSFCLSACLPACLPACLCVCVCVCVCARARACRPHSLPCDCSSARSHSLSLSSGSSILSVSLGFLTGRFPHGRAGRLHAAVDDDERAAGGAAAQRRILPRRGRRRPARFRLEGAQARPLPWEGGGDSLLLCPCRSSSAVSPG